MGRFSAAAMAMQTQIGAASLLVGAIAAFYKPSLSPKNSGKRKSQGHPPVISFC
jgi:hypothetical protein